MPLWVLASCTDPLSDHALELPHPKPFAQVNANGERVSENENGFALGVLVFEVVYIHSVVLVVVVVGFRTSSDLSLACAYQEPFQVSLRSQGQKKDQ